VQAELSAADLDLVRRGLGELLCKPGGDPGLNARVRELRGRLSRTEPAIADAPNPLAKE
jgi:hypothetical protein